MTDLVIAMDVGGTNIKSALMQPDGTVVHERRDSTEADNGPQAAIDRIAAVASELAELADRTTGSRPLAAGVVVPATIDERAGIAVHSANLGWRDVPLRDLLSSRLGMPVAIGHDVRAGCLAEARLGAGRERAVFQFVAVGTGISSAMAIGGQVHSGAHGSAGELGHLSVRPNGRRCPCGRRGCVETMASASAIARTYTAATGTPASAQQVATLAASGDPVAVTVWAEAVEAMADGLLAGITLIDPELIAIGGGLALAGEQLITPLRRGIAARLTFETMPEIVQAQLGYLASCLGAGLLAFDLIV